MRRILWLAGGIALAFLVGFAWQYFRAERLERALDDTSEELTFVRLETTLATAVLEAQSGSFELARLSASAFFSGLQLQRDRAPLARRLEVDAILAQRDPIITALSRGQTNATELLSRLFAQYHLTFAPEVDEDEHVDPAEAEAPGQRP